MAREERGTEQSVSLRRRIADAPAPVKAGAAIVGPGAVVAGALVAAPVIGEAAHLAGEMASATGHLMGNAPAIGLAGGASVVIVDRLHALSSADSDRKGFALLGGSIAAGAALGTSVAEASHWAWGGGLGVGAGAGLIVGFIAAISSEDESATVPHEAISTRMKRVTIAAASVASGAAMIDGAEHIGPVHAVSGHTLTEIGVSAALAGTVSGIAAVRHHRAARREARSLGG